MAYCTGCAQLLAKLKQAKAENERLRWQLQFCIDHDVKYVKADPLMSVEEFLNDRWEARP